MRVPLDELIKYKQVKLFFFVARLFLFSTVLPLLSTCTHHPPQPNPPNIILILADDLGYETIGANGGESYQTPEIDRMAAEGIRFEHAYAQPLCTPTRVKLMTGIYNVRNYVEFGLLHPSQTTFAHLFKNAGYATCITGKWQLGKNMDSPEKAGFDKHCLWQVGEGRTDSLGRDTRFSQPILQVEGKLKSYGKKDYGPDIVSQYGLDFIEENHQKGKPFLLYYPMILTHCPFSPTPDSPEWATDDKRVWSYKGYASYFEDMIVYTDKIIGQINAKLKELGIENNTLVIFTGDNGTDIPVVSMLNGRPVAGAKKYSTDGGTRVPLIIKWPAVIDAERTSSDLIDFCDFLPTLCDAAEIPVPDSLDIDGRSFLPRLKGETGQPRKWVYNWFSRGGDTKSARVFARNQQYKLYDTGEFYDIPADYEEKNPLNTDELNQEAREVYEMLSQVLEKYKDKRLDKIPDM